jgi:polyphenol oxidase
MSKFDLLDSLIQPDWPAPPNVNAIQTTRLGGVSLPPYDSLNLGSLVKDNPIKVAENRQLLSQFLPSEPVWLHQVHGVHVVNAAMTTCVPEADASFSKRSNVVCVTMTADCLPVLLCDVQGTVVAAIHAGWRSLCDGVIEAAVNAMQTDTTQLMAWMGPAIGPDAFEVGGEVRAQFVEHDECAKEAFREAGDKWLGNLYQIATQRLNKLGITRVYGGGECTYTNQEKFFSYRRDGETGRMATMIWMTS